MTSPGAARQAGPRGQDVRRRVVLPASGVRVARPAAPLQVQVTAVRTSRRRAFQFQLRVTRWPPDQFETQAVTGICQGWGGNRCERCGPGYSWWLGLGTCDEECWTGHDVRFLVSPIPAADRVRPWHHRPCTANRVLWTSTCNISQPATLMPCAFFQHARSNRTAGRFCGHNGNDVARRLFLPYRRWLVRYRDRLTIRGVDWSSVIREVDRIVREGWKVRPGFAAPDDGTVVVSRRADGKSEHPRHVRAPRSGGGGCAGAGP